MGPLFRVIFVNFLVVVFVRTGQTQDAQDRPSYRLPREVVPEHYDLEVHTHLGDDVDEGFRYFGVVNITVSYTIAVISDGYTP